MTAVAETKLSEGEVNNAVASSKRQLFNLLNEEAKERVVRAITAFRTLSLLEQEAFAQELGVCLPCMIEEHFVPGTRPPSWPELQVRSRDKGYVALAEPAINRMVEHTSGELTAMVVPFLKEKSVFDSQDGEKREGGGGQEEREAPSSKDHNEVDNAVVQAEGRALKEVIEHAPSEQPFLYRSRAYQALRLTRGDQHVPVDESFARRHVMNLTGMPIDEGDLWEWFDSLDVTRTGKIGVIPFLAAIKDLDRNFGVGEKAESEFAEEVEALATDGLLTFEQFAFLVLRFSRY